LIKLLVPPKLHNSSFLLAIIKQKNKKRVTMSIKIVCPHCQKVNRIPKKESYTKANCGACKLSLLDSKPISVNAKGFSNFVANSDLPIVVDFWAPWCGPCRMMAPSFEEAANSLKLKAQFIKVNTEEEQQLGTQFGIRSIPTIAIFKNGVEVDRVSGALSAPQIIEFIRKNQ
jgi:thioredoxin 2